MAESNIGELTEEVQRAEAALEALLDEEAAAPGKIKTAQRAVDATEYLKALNRAEDLPDLIQAARAQVKGAKVARAKAAVIEADRELNELGATFAPAISRYEAAELEVQELSHALRRADVKLQHAKQDDYDLDETPGKPKMGFISSQGGAGSGKNYLGNLKTWIANHRPAGSEKGGK